MYERRFDNARKAVAIAFVVCGAGLVIAARQNDAYRYYARRHDLWSTAVTAFEVSLLACLVVTAGLVVERLIRFWNGRSLAVSEVFLAGLLGLFACVAVVPAFCLGHLLCDNVGFQSLTREFATCATVCPTIGAGFGLHRFAKGRGGGLGALSRYEFAIAAIFGLIASAAFAAFAALRSDEGHRQQDASESLRSASCSVYYDYQVGSGGYSEKKSLSWAPDWLSSFAGTDFFHRVVRVDFANADADLNGLLPYLQKLEGLRYLFLPFHTPTDRVRQLEVALPSCEVKFTWKSGIEYVSTAFDRAASVGDEVYMVQFLSDVGLAPDEIERVLDHYREKRKGTPQQSM